MKIKKYYQSLALMLVASAGFMLTSCEDEPDKYEVADGLPTVNYIRCLSSEIVGNNDDEDMHYTNGELVESASPQALLCLVGDNLRSVCEIYFNDLQAVLNSSYITDKTLIVQVPRNIPNEVSNKIYLITQAKDTVTVDFEVVIPGPSISSMSCEYAEAGSKASIYGSYFINDPNVPLTVTFPDGTEITDLDLDDTYSTITFEVPNCTVSGPITVTSIYGTTSSSFYYKDTRGMLFDFDGLTGLGNHGWHDATITADETSITGNFLQLGNGESTLAESTWAEGTFSFEYWAGSWNSPTDYPAREGDRLFDIADFDDYANMAIKFELLVPSSYPWSTCALQVIPAGVDVVSMGSAGTDIYGNTVAGCNNSFVSSNSVPRALYRPWTDTGSFDTADQWITVTLPISASFMYGYDGSISDGTISKDTFASLHLFLAGGGVYGTDCTPILKIDNIRAVPYK